MSPSFWTTVSCAAALLINARTAQGATCNGQEDPEVCAKRGVEICDITPEYRVVMEKECPVLCNSCVADSTTKTTTVATVTSTTETTPTTATVTSTTLLTCNGKPDPAECASLKFMCTEEYSLIDPTMFLTTAYLCQASCNVCIPSTTTTTDTVTTTTATSTTETLTTTTATSTTETATSTTVTATTSTVTSTTATTTTTTTTTTTVTTVTTATTTTTSATTITACSGTTDPDICKSLVGFSSSSRTLEICAQTFLGTRVAEICQAACNACGTTTATTTGTTTPTTVIVSCDDCPCRLVDEDMKDRGWQNTLEGCMRFADEASQECLQQFNIYRCDDGWTTPSTTATSTASSAETSTVTTTASSTLTTTATTTATTSASTTATSSQTTTPTTVSTSHTSTQTSTASTSASSTRSSSATSSATSSASSTASSTRTTTATTTATTTPTTNIGDVQCIQSPNNPGFVQMGPNNACEGFARALSTAVQGCIPKFDFGTIQCYLYTNSDGRRSFILGSATPEMCAFQTRVINKMLGKLSRLDEGGAREGTIGCTSSGMYYSEPGDCRPNADGLAEARAAAEDGSFLECLVTTPSTTVTSTATTTVSTHVEGRISCDKTTDFNGPLHNYLGAGSTDYFCKKGADQLNEAIEECGGRDTRKARLICDESQFFEHKILKVTPVDKCSVVANALNGYVEEFSHFKEEGGWPGRPGKVECEPTGRLVVTNDDACAQTIHGLNGVVTLLGAGKFRCHVSSATTTATTSVSSTASSTATSSQSTSATSSPTTTVSTSATTSVTTSATTSLSSTATTSLSSTASSTVTTTATTSLSSTASSTLTTSGSTSATTTVTTTATTSASTSATTSASTSATTTVTTTATTSVSSSATTTVSTSVTSTPSSTGTTSATTSGTSSATTTGSSTASTSASSTASSTETTSASTTATTINECNLDGDIRSACDKHAVCIEKADAFACNCTEGWRGSGLPYECDDIDECAEGLHACHTNAVCKNTPGSYDCLSSAGYNCTADGSECANINECTTDNPCSEFGTCADTPGSYECTCNQGWVANGTLCVNVNECAEQTDDCAEQAKCVDEDGSFKCVCTLGWAGNGTFCGDVDECDSSPAIALNDCTRHSTCINELGKYDCECNEGWTGSGHKLAANVPEGELFGCTNVNECTSEDLHDCDVHATCRDNAGAFSCKCNTGWQGTGQECGDVDECSAGTDNCDRRGDCTNTEGGFECACSDGFAGAGTFGTCKDIDECEDENACHEFATCKNKFGTHSCTCNSGFSGDGLTCEDVDECAEASENPCGNYGTCNNNVAGTFECACDSGFENRDGPSSPCVNINECEKSSSCNVGDCIDTPGSFECCVNDDEGLRSNLEATFRMSDILTCGSALMFCNDVRIGYHVQWFCPQSCNKCDLKYTKRGDPPFLTPAPTLPGQTTTQATTVTRTTATTSLPAVYAVIRFTPDLTNLVANDVTEDDFAKKLKVALISALGTSPERINEDMFTVDGPNSNAVVAFASLVPGEGEQMRDSLSIVLGDAGIGFDFKGEWIMSVSGDGKVATTIIPQVGSTDLQAGMSSTQLMLIIFGGVILVGVVIWLRCAFGGTDEATLAEFESERKVQNAQNAIEMAQIDVGATANYMPSPIRESNAFMHNGMLVHSSADLRRSINGGDETTFDQDGPMKMAWNMEATDTDYIELDGGGGGNFAETSFMGESSADSDFGTPQVQTSYIRDSYNNQGSTLAYLNVGLPGYSTNPNTPAARAGAGAGAGARSAPAPAFERDAYIPGDNKPVTSPEAMPGSAEEWNNTEAALTAVLNYQASPGAGAGGAGGAGGAQDIGRIAGLEERIGALSKAVSASSMTPANQEEDADDFKF